MSENAVGAFNPADEKMIRYLGLNPSNPADQAAVTVARHYGLDPLLKHIVVIPGGGVYVTRDGLLHIAHRSGQLDGIVVEQDPTLVDGEWVARVTVYRRDMSHGFTYPGRYPANRGNRDYPQEMALKAAEAHALRRAFDINGLPAFDEQRTGQQAPASRGSAWPQRPPASPTVEPPPQAQRAVETVTPTAAEPEPVEQPAGETVEPEQPEIDLPDPASSQQLATLRAQYRAAQIAERADQLRWASQQLGREVESHKSLTHAEADALLVELRTLIEGHQMSEAVDEGGEDA